MYRTSSYYEPEPEPEPEPDFLQQQQHQPPPQPPQRPPFARDLEHGGGDPVQLELEDVHTRLHELELEGHETAQYVEKLQHDILGAQEELATQRQLKAELARRIGDHEHDSVETYHRNAATLEQNAQMQGELQRLQADMAAARADEAANRRLAAEREAELSEEQTASEALFKQVQALEAEAQGLEATIAQRQREKELELQTAQTLMADLKRLAPDLQAPGQPGVDQALRRQVLLLEGQNQELIQELAGWNAKAAKQGAIHRTVGEMTAQPLQLRAENTRLATELDTVQKQNARRQTMLTQHAFAHRQHAAPPPSPAPSLVGGSGGPQVYMGGGGGGGGGSSLGGGPAPTSSSASMQPTGPTSWF